MPTGYTADVGDGKVTEFSDFALTCARGFGALVLLRDSDQSLEATRTYIEEKAYLAKGGYYEKEIENADARLTHLMSMSDDEALAAAQYRAAEVEASNARYNAERSVIRERYEAMLARVEAWDPPTEEHAQFKEFMAYQLRESIKFDCSPFAMTVPEVSLAEHSREIEKQRDRIARAEDEIEKERARNEGRVAWISALLDSLEGVPA
jgi:hypothetical protein